MNNHSRLLAVLVMMLDAVTAEAAGCTIDSSGGLNFGEYNVFNATPTDSESFVVLTCDLLAPPIVSIEIGPSATSSTILMRQMQHASSATRLNYNLFIDPARTTVWGDYSTGTALLLTNINDGSPRQLRVYGRIPPTQNVGVGVYNDFVTVTVLP